MTLWCAAGISVAAAAIATSGSDPSETVQWLIDLCLTGPVDGEMPMIAMEEHRDHVAPSVAMGLGLISAALITGGLWPGRGGPAPAEADPDRVLAAMAHVASATGGISPPELAEQVGAATGYVPSVEDATLALRSYRGDADLGALAWIGAEADRRARDTIMTAALKTGWTHGAFTPRGLEMIGRLAETLGLSGDDLALLFWDATETPVHERADPLERLRPTSRMVRSTDPAMA